MNITVVQGGTGCGKTTFAAALAAQLARYGSHVLLISTDTYIPAFGLWVPKEKPPVSLGKILESTAPEKINLAAGVYIPRGLKENLGLLGFLPHETADKYNPASEQTASDFLRLASELADQVIVDGTVYGDTVTAAAIKAAGLRIRLLEPDLRGFLSTMSEPPEKDASKTLWIACRRDTGDPVTEIEKRLHISFAAKLPRLPEAHKKLTEGRLFEPYRDKWYRAAVKLAARAVLEGAA
jgi:MinD-like ATPase involved in chromosome partitioning or flagellar assembly